MFRHFIILMWLSFLGVLFSSALSAESQKNVDPIKIAAFLIQQGDWLRAEGYLDKMTSEEIEALGENKRTYYKLQGLLNLKKKEFQSSIMHFKQFLLLTTVDLEYRQGLQFLAKAYYGNQEFKQVIQTLEEKQNLEIHDSDIFFIWMHALLETKQFTAAYAKGRDFQLRSGNDPRLQRLFLQLLVELRLWNELKSEMINALESGHISRDNCLQVLKWLFDHRQFDIAVDLATLATMVFTEDPEIESFLARQYHSIHLNRSSLLTYLHLTHHYSGFSLEASEAAKEMGAYYWSLHFNMMVNDQKSKFKQRLSLWIAQENFDLILTLLPKLKQYQLVEDDSVRYAMAYTYYKLNQFDESVRWLNLIEDTQLFEDAVQLKKAILDCQSMELTCVL